MNTTAEHVFTNSTLSPFTDFSQASSIFKAANIVNLILGLPTNGYVLWLIASGVGGTMASEFFTLNMVVSDILSCLFSLIQILGLYHQIELSSHIYWILAGFVYTGRPLFQVCICLERYLAVVHPVVFLRYKPLRYRLACCVLVWMLIFLACLYCLFDNNEIDFFVFTIVLYPLLMSVHLFCCLSVLRALKRPGPGEEERERGSDIKRRAFKIILLILLTMLVSYLPCIASWSLMFSLSIEKFYLAVNISFSVTTVCGFVQPVLYLQRVGKLNALNLTLCVHNILHCRP